MSYFRRILIGIGFFALLSLTLTSAHALKLDPMLHGLCDPCSQGWPQPKTATFESLSRTYGIALAPTILAPANTIGINAFEVDFSYSMTMLTDNPDQWKDAIVGQRAPDQLMTTHFGVRKGLPFSFELDGQLGYMIDSELWTMGGGLKWSYHEAVAAFPIDFTIHGGGNRLVGSDQLDLSTFQLDLAIGTQFGVGNLFNMAPYVSYSPLWVFWGSSTLDATPGLYDVNSTNGGIGTSTAFVFGRGDTLVNRVGAGIRFLFGVLKVNPEFVWSSHQYSVNLGLGLHL
jgi:hypothetical protein